MQLHNLSCGYTQYSMCFACVHPYTQITTMVHLASTYLVLTLGHRCDKMMFVDLFFSNSKRYTTSTVTYAGVSLSRI